MSTIERYSRTIPASGAIEHGRGNVVLLISATAAINLRLENGGAAEGVNGAIGGVRIERRKPWDNLRILGTAGTTVEYWIGSQDVERDLIDVFTQIATIAGVASFAEVPSATFTTPAKATVNAATSADIAANLLRRRITIGNESDSPNSFWVRDQTATADAGIEVQPGTFVELKTTAALRIRNNGAGNCDYYTAEEV